MKLKTRTRAKGDLSMRQISELRSIRTFFAAVFLMSIFTAKQTKASGVFELELIRFQQLNSMQHATMNSQLSDKQLNFENRSPNDNKTATQLVTDLQQQDKESEEPLLRVLVCLKEAFTSQLDGPCTFGNATIALSRDAFDQSNSLKSTAQASSVRLSSAAKDKQLNQTHQQGSSTTNIVRILFTFRWTKSFTIILTAEQIEPTYQVRRHQALSATQEKSATTSVNLVDRQISSAAFGATAPSLSPDVVNQRAKLTQQQQQAAAANGLEAASNKSRLIDRHVLTENEVLPNLELNPSKPWANRSSRRFNSLLAYRFRVYCSLNYYGDGCTTFCRPRDDQFGHYNCSSLGQKVCLEGWYGTDCDKAKCRAGCNQQHGYCEKPDTCQCRPGWTGSRCDECITYPGCQNGYCLSPWQCICQRNWGGVLCDQDLNYCGTHEPCKNNGTCQNVAPGKYKCNCHEAFTGVDCDINLKSAPNIFGSLTQLSAGCVLNPCLNGGTCFGFNAPTSPHSLPGGALNKSEIKNSSVTLPQDSNHYRCQCLPGWTGDYCQWADSPAFSITNSIESWNVTEKSYYLHTNSTTDISTSPPINVDDYGVSEVLTVENSSHILDRPPVPFTTIIENPQPPAQHMDLKHLISWVIIASIVGVFLASLMLAWCCLIAIDRNKFSFIQMNIIRGQTSGEMHQSALGRMREKIRDSLRRSTRSRIKPETKLSIENVLRTSKPPQPPPPYEACSSNTINLKGISTPRPLTNYLYSKTKLEEYQPSNTSNESLVIKKNSKEELAAASMLVPSEILSSEARLSCPRHGHLYRAHQQRLQTVASSEVSIESSIGFEQPTRPPTYFHQKHHHQHHH